MTELKIKKYKFDNLPNTDFSNLDKSKCKVYIKLFNEKQREVKEKIKELKEKGKYRYGTFWIGCLTNKQQEEYNRLLLERDNLKWWKELLKYLSDLSRVRIQAI